MPNRDKITMMMMELVFDRTLPHILNMWYGNVLLNLNKYRIEDKCRCCASSCCTCTILCYSFFPVRNCGFAEKAMQHFVGFIEGKL